MTSTWPNRWATPQARDKQFDSDSHTLMLDDGASVCITNCMDDFIESPKRVDFKWYVEDDSGLEHIMVIKGAFLIPDAATRILSLQHLAQQADDHYPREEGTGALTTSKNITLFWSQRRFAKTVLLGLRTNVGLTTTTSRARSYRAYCATIDTVETMQHNIFTTDVIPDDEDNDSFQPRDPVELPAPEDEEHETAPVQSDKFTGPRPMTTLVDLGPISHVIPEDPEPTLLDLHDKLLRWHYRLRHLPFDQIMQLPQTDNYPRDHLLARNHFVLPANMGR